MPTEWKTIRIFISSTFRDMHAERDHLVRFVFPELRDRCAKRRLHLVDVDLRWGVTEEEAERGKVLAVCLDEIERCRPFFIGLLGERYGWAPPSYDVPDEPQYDWVRQYESGHSITAMEIYHGVLRNRASQPRAFFYFRDQSFLAGVPEQHRDVFLPENDAAAAKLERLKEEIRKHCPVFENYPCSYSGIREDGQVLLGGLDAFGQRVLEDLWLSIDQEYPDQPAPLDRLAVERAYHEAFIEGRSQRFIGRQDLLAQLAAYAESDEPIPLVVTGAPGSGKSALLANFAKEYAASHPQAFVLPHFIGVSPGSVDIRHTLARLCRELSGRFQIAEEIPGEYHELLEAFRKILEQAASRARCVLILDGLNQLDRGHYAHELHWLRHSLPPGLRLVVSTLAGDCLDALRRRRPALPELVVGPLSAEHRRELVRWTLGDYRKRLDERSDNDQMSMLLSKRESANALYLIVACEELRVFGDFERVTERIAILSDHLAGLLHEVLERLEHDHGKELVEAALSLIGISRHGLLEGELLAVLGPPGDGQLPPAVWARLYRGLHIYLRPPGEAGEGALDFFHQQMAEAVRRRYIESNEDKIGLHRRLAEMFSGKADPAGDRTWAGSDPRGLSELPYHLLEGKLYRALFQTARDEAFLSAQMRAFYDELRLLETTQAAIEGSSRSDDASAMAEFVLAHARRVLEVGRESPLEALRDGNLTRAWAFADLCEIELCVLWHLLLAWELIDTGEVDQARATVIRLQERTLPPLKDWKSELGGHLLGRIAGRCADGVPGGELSDDARLVYALMDSLGLGEFRKQAEALSGEPAVEGTCGIADTSDTRTLCAIAAAQARAGDLESSRKTFSAAVQAAFAIDDVWHEADEPEQGVRRLGYQAAALSEIAAAQAQAGDFTAALSTAQSIEAAEHLVNALSAIGVAQAQAGAGAAAGRSFDRAAESATKIAQEQERAMALSVVAAARARAGDVAGSRSGFDSAIESALKIDDQGSRHVDFRAGALVLIGIAQERATDQATARTTFALSIQTVGRIDDRPHRAEALREIAGAAAKLGGAESARAIFKTASDTALKIEYAWDRNGSLRDIAGAQAQAGDFAAALQTEKLIPEWWARTEALRMIAGAQADSGDFDGAIETATSIPSSYERDRFETLCIIAKAQADAGDFNAAIRTAGFLDRSSARSQALSDIAAAYGRAGNFTAALRVSGETDDNGARVEALCAIASSQSQAGDAAAAAATFNSASQIARSVFNHSGRAAALSTIAAAQALAGAVPAASESFRAATQEAEAVEDAWHRGEALREVAIAQASTKQFAAALETAQKVAKEDQRATALAAIARAQAQSGEFRAAAETARRIDDASQRALLCEVAVARAEGGELALARDSFAEAVALVDRIADQRWRGKALAAIAVAQAKAGLGVDASRTAGMIPTDRDSLLPDIGQALTDGGDEVNFKSLLIPCAYYLNAAYRMCGLIARLYPERATAIAAEVSGGATHETPPGETTADPQRASLLNPKYQEDLARWKAYPRWKRLIIKKPKPPGGT